MIISPSIRPSCGKTTASISIPTLFGCWQMWNPDRQNVKIKYNVTKMKDYAAGTSDWINPYATANPTQDICSTYLLPPDGTFVCGNGTNGNVWCWPIDDTYIALTSSGQVSFPVGNFHNVYSQSNDTRSHDTCRDIGFKNLYASKAWVGRLSYTSKDLQIPDCWDWCCDGCGYHNADTSSHDNTKYRTISATSTENLHTDVYNCNTVDEGTQYCCSDEFTTCTCGTGGCGGDTEIYCTTCTLDHSTDFGGDASATTTIDTHGNISVASCASSSYGCYDDGNPDDIAYCEEWESDKMLGLLSNANADASSLISSWCGYMQSFGNFAMPDVITGGCGSWHLEWHTTIGLCIAACGGGLDSTTELVSMMDITPSTLNVYMYGSEMPQGGCNNAESCNTWIQTGHMSWTYSETGFDFILDATGEGSISFNQQFHQEVHGSLADAYTTQQVYADMVNNLLSQWDIGDTEQYPWRTDSSTTMGPIVRYDEGQNSPSVPTYQTSSQFSGKILGAPGPLGIDKIWIPDHPNICICEFTNEDSDICRTPYIESYGAWSTDCGVPRATEFLNALEANNMPQGAFVGANFSWTSPSTCGDITPYVGHDDILYSCIYAEAIYPKQSFNYARPIGLDRFQYSESTQRCIVSSSLSSSGYNISIDNSGTPTSIPENSLIWVCGTSTLDGLWSGSSDNDYIIKLNEPRIISASQIATQPVEDCGTGLVYQLKWNPLKPAICGRIAINSVTNVTPITCSIDDATYLVNGDNITITGSTGLTSINGNWPVIVIDSQTFVLSGSVSGSTSYLGGGQVYSTNAPDWKWCDVSSKGEFTYKNWLFNYRDVGEYQRVLSQYNWNMGIPYDCSSGAADNCPEIPSLPDNPRANQAACGMDQNIIISSCITTCLPFNPCRVNAAYFAPLTLTESFNKSGSHISYSLNLGWAPSALTSNPVDHNYTTMWQAIPNQAMDDLYFQSPPCTCIDYTDPDTEVTTFECDPNCTWQEDNGNCEIDVVGDPELTIPCQKYFAARNVYEARCSPPSGSPALQSGVYMGCLTPNDLTGSSCPSGNICSAPVGTQGSFPMETTCQPYLPHNYTAPWLLLFAKEGCVCFDGRFTSNYLDNGVSCPIDIAPAP